MATTYRSALLAILRDNDRDVDRFYDELLALLYLILLRYADRRGDITPSLQDDVQRAMRRVVLQHFLADGLPYTGVAIVIPRSPYMRFLWERMMQAGELAVDEQRAIARRQRIPLARGGSADETRQALAGYAAPLERRRDDGMVFRDRLKRVAEDYARRVDGALLAAFGETRNAALVYDALQRMTREGHGRYAGRRLARTETISAYSWVGWGAARLNPAVVGFRTQLSPTHDHVDICDDVAGGGPYRLDEVEFLPPLHSHCKCAVVWIIGRKPPASGAYSLARPDDLARLLLNG